jgi:hypothetical protein
MVRSARLGLASAVLAASFLACSDDPEAPPVTGDADASAPGTGDASTSDTGPGPGPGPDAGSDAGADADAGEQIGAHVVGYAYVENEASPMPGAPAAWSYNASGGAVSVTRVALGLYDVDFAALALEGSVTLATAYGSTGTHCNWASTAGSKARVRCWNSVDSNVDSKFTVTVFASGGTAGASILGFALADQMASASYTPAAAHTNNALGGGAVTVARTSTGTYTVEFGGLEVTDIKNVQVMPYGSETARCVLHSWSNITVSVRCYEGAALADAQYAVMLLGQKAGATVKVRAFAHANESANPSYAPTVAFNEGGGAVTATRSAAGTYAVSFDGRNLDTGAHVQVAAQNQNRRCNVGSWGGSSASLTCTNAVGTKGDNSFGIVVLQ